jgi:PilZ domain
MYESQRPTDSERRIALRHAARVAGCVEGKLQDKRLCLIRNLSVTGALLLTESPLEIGESVHLDLYLDDDSTKTHTASARVVRIEPSAPGQNYPWLLRAAVKFEKPVIGVLSEIRALADKQARLGIAAES